MRKEWFYKVIIIVLLLLNFGVLGYLWTSNKPHSGGIPPHDEPAGFIIGRLQLDQDQRMEFEKLKHAHQKASRYLKEESRQLHDALFSTLHDVSDSAIVDSILSQIAKNDSAKEQLNYNNFKELKAILKPEQ